MKSKTKVTHLVQARVLCNGYSEFGLKCISYASRIGILKTYVGRSGRVKIPLRLRRQAARASKATHPCTSTARTRGRFAIAAESRLKLSRQSVYTTPVKRKKHVRSAFASHLRPPRTLKSWFCSVGTSLDLINTCGCNADGSDISFTRCEEHNSNTKVAHLKVRGVTETVKMHCHPRAPMYVRAQYPVTTWGYLKRNTRPNSILATEPLLKKR